MKQANRRDLGREVAPLYVSPTSLGRIATYGRAALVDARCAKGSSGASAAGRSV
jgi:hypothetical protein